jgi:hypothetical protein
MRKRPYTYIQMRQALTVGWGPLGARVAKGWLDYNRVYWEDKLKPLPIFLTPTSPYGHWIGLTCCSETVTHIAMTAPRVGKVLVADRNTLLHEMIHQYLFETGQDPKHEGEPWRKEIMRLHELLTGETIWAGAYTVKKVRQANGRRKSVKGNRAEPRAGRPSITQGEIARWPQSLGIRLGSL